MTAPLSSFLAVALAATVGAGAAVAQTATPAHRRPAPPAAAPAPPQPATSVASGMGAVVASPTQKLATALNQIGLTSCSAAVMQAGTFLFEDGQANFIVQPLGPDANRWPTVIVIEGAHAAQGTTRLTTLTVSPGPACSGFYQQTIYWPQPCAELKRTVFADFKTTGLLLKHVEVSELNAAVQLYLTPAGAGCLSEKKELFR